MKRSGRRPDSELDSPHTSPQLRAMEQQLQPEITPKPRPTWLTCVGGILAIVIFVFFFFIRPPTANQFRDPVEGKYQVMTWNLAAINNNPFEYWIRHKDKNYNKMMDDIQHEIADPGNKDIKIKEVFTQTMFDELITETQALWGTDMGPEIRERWASLKEKTIIDGFLKDKSIGAKRLASMPDRVTNTIDVEGDTKVVYRPTPINCYESPLPSQEEWWEQWQHFMFHKRIIPVGESTENSKLVGQLLSKIPRDKYPALTEEEERISLPLQVLNLAIFDAILVHLLNKVTPGNWHGFRREICEALNLKKTQRTLEILGQTYADSQVICLQEVSTAFIEAVRTYKQLSHFHVLAPEKLGKRDQNSIILLNKVEFPSPEPRELTKDLSEDLPLSAGDLLAVSVTDKSGQKFLVASFHGDTNGLATIPIVRAVHTLAVDNHLPHLLFGLDANTYENPKPNKQQGVKEFGIEYAKLGMSSCWGDQPQPSNYTTFNARTYLQPQLNKATSFAEVRSKGDVNPKDFILFFKNDMKVLHTGKDNTGHKHYREGVVFPDLAFPSDHGALYTVVE